MKNFKLTNGFRSYLIKQIQEMDLTEPKRVDIVDWKGKRGLSANALSWIWYDIIGNEFGMLTDEVHSDCKIRFGLPILFARKDEAAYDLADDLDSIGFWNMDLQMQWRRIKNKEVTRTFNTKEMSDYLESIQIFYGAQGLALESS